MGNTNSGLELRAGVRALLEKDHSIDDHAVWRRLFTAKLMYLDFAVQISPDAVRFLRRCRPHNLAVLLYKCVEQVQIFVSKQGEVDDQSAKNAIGCLARVLPFVFERADAIDPVAAAAAATAPATMQPPRHVDPNGDPIPMYQPTPPEMIQREPPVSQFYADFVRLVFAENCMCKEDDPTAKFPLKGRFGELLINSLVAAAFVPGFTIGDAQSGGLDPQPGHPMVDSGLLWCAGIATHPTARLHWKEAHNINRRAVIFALISSLSGELYRQDALAIDWFHRTLTDLRACPHAVTLVCSLTNFMIGYEPRGILPYTSHLITGAEDLAFRCAQLLCLMADTSCFYDAEAAAAVAASSAAAAAGSSSAPSSPTDANPAASAPRESDGAARANEPMGSKSMSVSDGEGSDEADDSSAGTAKKPSAGSRQKQRSMDDEQRRLSHLAGPRTPHTHPVWVFFSNLSNDECTRVLRGIIRLAGNPTYAKSTYLPGSQRTVEYNDEYFILLWKLLDRCGNFLRALCTQPELIHELMVPLLDFGLEARQHDGRFSPMQLMMFILMRLSAITDFTIACNEPFNKWLPFELPPFVGTYTDLLLLAMHTLLVCKHKWVQHVHLSAAMVINNVSSYATTLSQTTSAKLVFLLEMTSNALYLEARPDRPQIFYYVAEALANLVQYQFQASLHVVYGLVRQEKMIKDLYAALEQRKLPISEALAKKLHVGTLCCAIDAAQPIISAALARDSHANVVERLGKATLVGKLPVPHRIITHHFESREGTDAWLTSWLWSCVFLHSYQQLADGKKIALFGLRK